MGASFLHVTEIGIDKIGSDELYEDVRICYEIMRCCPEVDPISCTRLYVAAMLAADEDGKFTGDESEIVAFIVHYQNLIDFVLLNAIGHSSNG